MRRSLRDRRKVKVRGQSTLPSQRLGPPGHTPISGRASGQSPYSRDKADSLPQHDDKVRVHFGSRQNACLCNTDSMDSLGLVGSQRRQMPKQALSLRVHITVCNLLPCF